MRTAAHPRVCGENFRNPSNFRKPLGSSPRVRGKHGYRLACGLGSGLIPACAGKTFGGLYKYSCNGAHPRVCGENFRNPSNFRKPLGSSPRVRGKLSHISERVIGFRLIPACAGKTLLSRAMPAGVSAHPRVCGENQGPLHTTFRAWGSSPRVRGKLAEVLGVAVSDRLIPACAGKTDEFRGSNHAPEAHPRVCGENKTGDWYQARRIGSSPRVRGKRMVLRSAYSYAGLIPACAGKTLASPGFIAQTPAHPRVCGENLPQRSTLLATSGSSPRVRGKLLQRHAFRMGAGLIPACAGKTLRRCDSMEDLAAHPRVCGENHYDMRVYHTDLGSSPRVRGKQRVARLVPRRRGLIPACAGKTRGRRRGGLGHRAHPRVCGENFPCSI